MTPEDRVAELDWWHTIELARGLVTPGGRDLRPTAAQLPWPSTLAGLRCLDVGTMDGFWAFELERRGAAEVVALAAELLDSRVELRDLSVYDLDPADVGGFNLIVMGYVLQMLRDPLRALEALRSVCRGNLILLGTISRPLELLPAPLARLDARRDGSEWFVFNRRGLRKALALTGWVAETTTPVLRDRPGPGVGKHELALAGRTRFLLGVRGRSAAVRARPLTL